MKGENVINQKYGRLLIIADGKGVIESKRTLRTVICKCDCGNTKELKLKYIKRGDIKSCGCLALEQKTVVNEGATFGLWTVLKETEGYFDRKGEKTDRTFACKCVCGKERNVNLRSLVAGSSKSCGCQGIPPKEKIKKEKIIPTNTEEEQWKESVTFKGYYVSSIGRVFGYESQYMFPKKMAHNIQERGFSVTKEMYKAFIEDVDFNNYQICLEGDELKVDKLYVYDKNCLKRKRLKGVYATMKSRCENPNNKDYYRYGGKGIIIEESFNTFQKFYLWALEQGYEIDKGLEVDRKDSKGNYSVDNCRIVTKSENILNMERIKLSVEDVQFIRSDEFDINNIPEHYVCTDRTIQKIRNYEMVKDINPL